MKERKHVTPTRTVVSVDTENYPHLVVHVLVEFDPPEDPAQDQGERYFSKRRVTVGGGPLALNYHHQRSHVLEVISRQFQDYASWARDLGNILEFENATKDVRDDEDET